jgi:membrane protein implicated in regulation of membrane protease activity
MQMQIEPWHAWTFAGIILWIAEVFTSGFILGLFGLACFAAAIASAQDAEFKVQLLVFGGATAALALGIRPLVLRYLSPHRQGTESNVHALIGLSGLVTEKIDNLANSGRVRVGNEEWRATVEDAGVLSEGTRVKVEKVEGCKLVVIREGSPAGSDNP